MTHFFKTERINGKRWKIHLLVPSSSLINKCSDDFFTNLFGYTQKRTAETKRLELCLREGKKEKDVETFGRLIFQNRYRRVSSLFSVSKLFVNFVPQAIFQLSAYLVSSLRLSFCSFFLLFCRNFYF